MSDGISRRNFAKYAGVLGAAGLAGCAGGNGGDGGGNGGADGGGGGGGGSGGNGGGNGGGGGDGSGGNGGSGMESGSRPMQWIGPSWAIGDAQDQKFTEVTGIELNHTTASGVTAVQQVLSGLNETFDAAAHSAHVGSAMTLANPTVETIPTSDLDKWGEGMISEIFLNPSEGLPAMGEQADILSNHIYDDPEEKSDLLMPPHVFNLDAIAINPKQVSRSTNTWSALFDRQFQGQTAFCDIAIIGGLEAMMHAKDNNIIDISLANLNNPSEDQIDQLIDFLVKEKQAGQFRTTWQTFGNSINIFASEEAIVADLWQPAVYGTRAEGTPCIYATHPQNTIQGEMFWYGGIMPLTPGVHNRDNYDEVLSLIEEIHWGAWFPRHIASVGYMTPNYIREDLVRDGSDETGQGMGPEYYDWSYQGVGTYEPIDQPTLFVPSEYDWSMEEGSPSSDGKIRDGGSLSERLDRTTTMWIFPENGPYLQEEWKRFRSA